MENQHRKIKGYRELNQKEIDLMNRIKNFGPELDQLISDLNEYGDDSNQCDDPRAGAKNNETADPCDHRWISIGKTHLQQGLMALTRAVAKPDFF